VNMVRAEELRKGEQEQDRCAFSATIKHGGN
jgi:hypothetical protein